jgi:hypothetical protein
MKPTFDLIEYLKLKNDLIPYIMEDEAGNNISFFNGIVKSQKELDAIYENPEIQNKDPFNTKLPNLTADPDTIAGFKIDSFKNDLIRDWHAGWKNLMSCDEWSTRNYMTLGPSPYAVNLAVVSVGCACMRLVSALHPGNDSISSINMLLP